MVPPFEPEDDASECLVRVAGSSALGEWGGESEIRMGGAVRGSIVSMFAEV